MGHPDAVFEALEMTKQLDRAQGEVTDQVVALIGIAVLAGVLWWLSKD